MLVAEIPESPSGSWSVDDVRCNRSYSIKLRVTLPQPGGSFVGWAQIATYLSNSYAYIGSPYQFPAVASAPTENDTGSFLQSMSGAVEPGSHGFAWIVTLEYGPFDVLNLLGSSHINQGLIDPLDAAWQVYWSTAKYERFKPQDVSDPPNPFVNTAGGPLLNPPPFEETRPVLKLIHNEQNYNQSYADIYKDTVNSDVFLGYPPNTVKCMDITGERRWDADWGWAWQVTYIFEFRDDDDGNGYYEMVPSLGYMQKANGVGLPVPILVNGQQPSDAVPLQENGAYSPPADPYLIQFQLFPMIAFESLNIPQDILTQNT
jgi:hypothetical protein